MRLLTNLQDSEVFRSFMEIAEKENMMEKKANLLYPDYDISQVNPELDISISVTASEYNKLYDVTSEKGEDLVNAAHPGGGTETQLDVTPSDKLGLVETIVEQHKSFEDIARGTPSGKLASLSERLVRLADKFEEAGFEVIADHLTNSLSEIADVVKHKKVAVDLEGTHISARSPEEFRQDIAKGNLRAQKLLNKLRSAKGLEPIREDGIMGRETLGALSEAGVAPGTYRTWGELYSKLNGALEKTMSQQPRARQTPVDLTRHDGLTPPAQLPAGALDLEKKDLPLPNRKPSLPLQNDDGMEARDAKMLEQDCGEMPELKAEDPAALREKALQDAKRRLQEAELQKALQGIKPPASQQTGLAPRDLPPASTETFKLTKTKPQARPEDQSMLPGRTDRPVPQQQLDPRVQELSPAQYWYSQNK